MKYLPLLLIIFLSSSLFGVEYERAIKIASFHKSCTAKDAIKTLSFLDLKALSQHSILNYKVEKYGKYYVLKIQPFTDKLSLQEALDKIRTVYKDAYVSKIRQVNIVNVQKPQEIKIVEKEKIVIRTEIKEIVKVVEVPVEIIINEESILFQVLFFIMLILFIGVIFVVIKLRKKQNELEEKNRELAENSIDFDNLDFDESELDLDADLNLDEIFGTKESIK